MDLLFDADAPWTLVITSNDVDVLGRCERTFSLTGGRLEKLQPTSTASA
jgi:predicted ABC-type transport system involved in lysophospholipase L1 biosynthesis ATPase subunit